MQQIKRLPQMKTKTKGRPVRRTQNSLLQTGTTTHNSDAAKPRCQTIGTSPICFRGLDETTTRPCGLRKLCTLCTFLELRGTQKHRYLYTAWKPLGARNGRSGLPGCCQGAQNGRFRALEMAARACPGGARALERAALACLGAARAVEMATRA